MRVLGNLFGIGLCFWLTACIETTQNLQHTLGSEEPKPVRVESRTSVPMRGESIRAMRISPLAPETDAEIVEVLIERSIEKFGACPCPYSTDSSGQRCGGRSTYVERKRSSLLCYPTDVTPAMIVEYRTRQ